MKKLALIVILIYSIVPLFAQPRKAITVNPLGLFWGVLNVQYEFYYEKNNSISVRGNFVGYEIGSFSNTAFGVGSTYRWYHNKKPVVGLWYGPSADLLIWSAKEKARLSTNTYQSLFLGLGGDVGYKWNFNQFGVEVFGGLRYYFGHIANLDFGGAALIAGVSLGYLW